MTTQTHRRLAAFVLLAGLALGGFARAQTPAPATAPPAPGRTGQPAPRPGTKLDDTPTFGERIEVRVVNVEVVVTDKAGNRVPDLTAKDFVLKVDGKVTPVEFFGEVRGGDAVVPAATAGDAAPAVAGLPNLAPGSPVGTSYLVFIDDYWNLAGRRDEVLRKLKDDLGQLAPEDRMAIVAYDGRKLAMLQSWTDNQSALGRALTQATTRPAHGLERLAEQRAFDSSRRTSLSLNSFAPGSTTATNFSNRLDIEELDYANRLADKVSRSVEAAVSTLRSFASPPGRKVMLLLSGPWPSSPADYAVNNGNRPILEREVPRGDTLLRPLANAANLLGYTVYPVDVHGLETAGADASEGGVPDTNVFPVRQQEIFATLDYIAEETGGRALRAGLRKAILGTAAGDTRSYYWLGFSPLHHRDDKKHDVKVEVRRSGLKVRSRSGYVDLSKNGESAMMVESAMLFGNAGGESLPIEVGAPVAVKGGELEVPIKLALPVAAMTVIPIDGQFKTELELRAAALDVKGNRSDIPVVPIRLAFPRAPELGKYVPYSFKMKVRKIQQHLVVAVFDPVGGKILTAEVDVTPPK